MIVPPRHLTDSPTDPEPTVPSDDSIRIAQLLRETIRHQLLNGPEPPTNPYWAIGAD
jgi:hypothetical protein